MESVPLDWNTFHTKYVCLIEIYFILNPTLHTPSVNFYPHYYSPKTVHTHTAMHCCLSPTCLATNEPMMLAQSCNTIVHMHWHILLHSWLILHCTLYFALMYSWQKVSHGRRPATKLLSRWFCYVRTPNDVILSMLMSPCMQYALFFAATYMNCRANIWPWIMWYQWKKWDILATETFG